MALMVPPTNPLFAAPLGAEWAPSNANLTRVNEPYYGPSGYSVMVVATGAPGSDPCVVYDLDDLIAFVGDTNIIWGWIYSAGGDGIRCGWNEFDSSDVYLRTRANAFNALASGWNFITCTSVIGASTRYVVPFFGRGNNSISTCWVAAIGIPQIYPGGNPNAVFPITKVMHGV